MEFASPTFLGVQLSLSMVVWCAVGGRQSLVGALLGAILVAGMQGALSESEVFLDTWTLFMGALFVLVVLFLPNGIASVFQQLSGGGENYGRAVKYQVPRRSRRSRCSDERASRTAGTSARASTASRPSTGCRLPCRRASCAASSAQRRRQDTGARSHLRQDGAGLRLDPLPGHRAQQARRLRIARAGVGRKFQVPSVFRQLTVRENLEVADCKRNGVLSNLLRSANSADSDGLDKLAEFVGLVAATERSGRPPVARPDAVAGDRAPACAERRLILLDEPTAGMTAQETQKTADICNR